MKKKPKFQGILNKRLSKKFIKGFEYHYENIKLRKITLLNIGKYIGYFYHYKI